MPHACVGWGGFRDVVVVAQQRPMGAAAGLHAGARGAHDAADTQRLGDDNLPADVAPALHRLDARGRLHRLRALHQRRVRQQRSVLRRRQIPAERLTPAHPQRTPPGRNVSAIQGLMRPQDGGSACVLEEPERV